MSAEKRKREKDDEDEKLLDETATHDKPPVEKKRRSNDETNKKASEDTIPMCSICLDTVDTKHKYSLPCNHVFHEVCINQWLERSDTCPLCRSSVDELHFALLIDETMLRVGGFIAHMGRIQAMDEARHRGVVAIFDQLHADIQNYFRDGRNENLDRVLSQVDLLNDVLTPVLRDIGL